MGKASRNVNTPAMGTTWIVVVVFRQHARVLRCSRSTSPFARGVVSQNKRGALVNGAAPVGELTTSVPRSVGIAQKRRGAYDTLQYLNNAMA